MCTVYIIYFIHFVDNGLAKNITMYQSYWVILEGDIPYLKMFYILRFRDSLAATATPIKGTFSEKSTCFYNFSFANQNNLRIRKNWACLER